jgi:hypothetical protein
MNTLREMVGVGAVLLGVAALAAVNHHPDHGRRTERERQAIETAAAGVAHAQIADAWAQSQLGNSAPMSAVRWAFPLPLQATAQDGAGIVLTFAGHDGNCFDLRSLPDSGTVTARTC